VGLRFHNIVNRQIEAYIGILSLVPDIYLGLAFIGDPAIIRDLAFIYSICDKKPLAFNRDPANGTWLLLEVVR